MRCRSLGWSAFGALACIGNVAHALELNIDDPASIKAAAKSIATDMMSYYVGDQPGQTPGMLPGSGQEGGYFWWVGGGMFGTMVNYWYYTGDDTWVPQTSQAMVFQSSPSEGGFFEPSNQTLQLGNDDQAFWALAAMAAAEYNFPNPPADQPQWLAMAQGVFNRQFRRWDAQTCNGGMRWQVFQFNDGYDYKNSISNGCFFQLAARLGKYTGNSTYTNAAVKWWDWSVSSGLINETNWAVVDGIKVDTCNSDGHGDRWTYNVGVYLYGAAVMWNITGDPAWQQRTEGLLSGTDVFFKDGPQGSALTEVICEPQDTCKVDQSSFKAYLTRWMTAAAKVAPFIADTVRGKLADSAAAAAVACSNPGGNGGTQCGEKWYVGEFDGKIGIGMDMNAIEVMVTMIDRPGPITAQKGTSKGNVAAGSGDLTAPVDTGIINVTTADMAGASILTILLALTTLAGAAWIIK